MGRIVDQELWLLGLQKNIQQAKGLYGKAWVGSIPETYIKEKERCDSFKLSSDVWPQQTWSLIYHIHVQT